MGKLVYERNATMKIEILLNFSVIIAELRLFTGVAGIPPTVQLCANKNIGIENIKECADENDEKKYLPIFYQ